MKIKYLLFALVFAASCGDDDPVCETTGLTYNNDIAALVNTSCATAGCHAAGSTTTFPMSNFDEITVAVSFDRIEGAINHQATFSAMPKDGDKLDQCSIDKITQWIADGAPE